ncbi:MAG TPA: hypothetical protein VFV50_07085 [Bdellovibrionales bacterium]|nr:hypothetical protein [Bdellovibrionales bacterium]
MSKLMIAATLILGSLFAASAGHACAKAQADIEARGVGARVTNGVCEISIEITKVTGRHPVCPLRVRVGQEVAVITQLTPQQCPQDEVKLKGQISSGGSGRYIFRGKIN